MGFLFSFLAFSLVIHPNLIVGLIVSLHVTDLQVSFHLMWCHSSIFHILWLLKQLLILHESLTRSILVQFLPVNPLRVEFEVFSLCPLSRSHKINFTVNIFIALLINPYGVGRIYFWPFHLIPVTYSLLIPFRGLSLELLGDVLMLSCSSQLICLTHPPWVTWFSLPGNLGPRCTPCVHPFAWLMQNPLRPAQVFVHSHIGHLEVDPSQKPS